MKADQKLAVANAKLEAMKGALWESCVPEKAELAEIRSVCSSKLRTKDWVNSNPQPKSRIPNFSVELQPIPPSVLKKII